jgi:sugar lactone lactonase YvrE
MHATTWTLGNHGVVPRLVTAALLATTLLAGAERVLARSVAVAVDEEDGGASVTLIDTRSPWPARTGTVAIGRDSILRTHGRVLYALSRSDGRLRVVDPHRGRVLHRVDVGADGAPEDVAVIGKRRAYVTRRDATHLLRVDPTTGKSSEVVDLRPLAGPDGIPDMGTMARHGNRLFVQLRRLNAEGPAPFDAPAMLAVVDLRSETLLDVDPERPGVQGIELAGTPPKFKMQAAAAAQRLFVSATGGFFDQGGIEAVDLGTLRSLGLVLREEDGQAGADVGAFVMTERDVGYLTFSTDLLLSSHLVRFRPGVGVVSGELHVTLDYFVPAILHDRPSGQLFVIDGGVRPAGVFVFDAVSGERRNDQIIETDGFPTDAVLLPGSVRVREVEAVRPERAPRLPRSPTL